MTDPVDVRHLFEDCRLNVFNKSASPICFVDCIECKRTVADALVNRDWTKLLYRDISTIRGLVIHMVSSPEDIPGI